jgi:hypothetical protein
MHTKDPLEFFTQLLESPLAVLDFLIGGAALRCAPHMSWNVAGM